MNKVLSIIFILILTSTTNHLAQETNKMLNPFKNFEIEGVFEVVEIHKKNNLYYIYILKDSVRYIVLSRVECSQEGYPTVTLGFKNVFKIRSLFPSYEPIALSRPHNRLHLSGTMYDGQDVRFDDSTVAYRDIFLSDNLQGLSYIPSNVECECKVPRVRYKLIESDDGSEDYLIFERY